MRTMIETSDTHEKLGLKPVLLVQESEEGILVFSFMEWVTEEHEQRIVDALQVNLKEL